MMDGLLPLLIFGGLFYLMMRFGCGSHMMHGRHRGHRPKSEGAGKHRDPVCGKHVPPEEGYGKMHAGQLYRFCSHECLETFDANPERYIEATQKQPLLTEN